MVSEEILKTIHQCVIHSAVRHILKYPTEYIIECLTRYPFFRRSDVLYYLLLKRDGKEAYYNGNGVHVLSIHPELVGVYVLAGADVNARILKDDKAVSLSSVQIVKPTVVFPSTAQSTVAPTAELPSTPALPATLSVPTSISQSTVTPSVQLPTTLSVYSIIKDSIDRFVKCKEYNAIHDIITEEACPTLAMNIPSIALNLHKYQTHYKLSGEYSENVPVLLEFDCLEPFTTLNPLILTSMIGRITVLMVAAPELWKNILSKYYENHLLRLKIHAHLKHLRTCTIQTIGTIFPQIVELPSDLGSLCLKIWFSTPMYRGYLLGYNLTDGMPCHESLSYQLKQLNKYGIEAYVKMVTKIHKDRDGMLSGFIGFNYYPHIVGRKLMNIRDSTNRLIESYAPSDLIPVIYEEDVYILTEKEFEEVDKDLSMELLMEFIGNENIPYFDELDDLEMKRIYSQLEMNIGSERSLPLRTLLVEFE